MRNTINKHIYYQSYEILNNSKTNGDIKNIADYRPVFSASLGHYNERISDGQFIEIVLVSDIMHTYEYEHIMQEIPAMYIKNGYVYVREKHVCIYVDLQYIKLPK